MRREWKSVEIRKMKLIAAFNLILLLCDFYVLAFSAVISNIREHERVQRRWWGTLNTSYFIFQHNSISPFSILLENLRKSILALLWSMPKLRWSKTIFPRKKSQKFPVLPQKSSQSLAALWCHFFRRARTSPHFYVDVSTCGLSMMVKNVFSSDGERV